METNGVQGVNVWSIDGPEWLYRGRVPCLDGLRAVAIVLVLIEHISLTNGLPAWTHGEGIGKLGYLGVSMFFGISGFLITLLMVREQKRTAAVSLGKFYRRRACRILPAYVTYLIAVYALTRLQAFTLTGSDWRAALTYTVNFLASPAWEIGHLWSLSVEEQFYLVWPLMFVGLGPVLARRALVIYLIAAPLLRVGLWAISPPTLYMLNQTMSVRLDVLAGGCLLALSVMQPQKPRLLEFVRRHAAGVEAAAATVLLTSAALTRVSWGYDATLRYAIDGVALVMIIWAVANGERTWAGRLLEAGPVVSLGVLSYSLYLWQQLLIGPHHRLGGTALALHCVVAVVIAIASHVAIERPFLRLKGTSGGSGHG